MAQHDAAIFRDRMCGASCIQAYIIIYAQGSYILAIAPVHNNVWIWLGIIQYDPQK